MDLSDQHLQMMREQLKVPHLLCPTMKQVLHICTNNSCKAKSAFCCESEDCQCCREEHLGCESVKLKDIIKLVEKRTEHQRNIIGQMLEIEQKRIEQIRRETKEIIDQYRWAVLPAKYKRILDKMFGEEKEKAELKPNMARDFVAFLREKRDIGKDLEFDQLKQFKEETTMITITLRKLKEEIINSLQKEAGQIEPKRQIALRKDARFLRDSKIIKETAQFQFILESLKQPKQLELLFMASEYQFSAEAFHHLCDHIPHTFTLIKTEFGRTIAGYTPLSWQSPENAKDLADPSKQSFLLSIDLKQKMTLVNPEKAISCDKHYGPIFGGSGGRDICVYDRCHEESNAANFPSSYNCSGMYQKNKKGWVAFTGAVNSKYFSIIEYEVYRVMW